MTTYELTLVISGANSEAQCKAYIEKFRKLVAQAGGEISQLDEWGKRELAFALKKQREGFYYNLLLNLPGDKIGALNRFLENDDETIRHLIIKGTGSKEKVSPHFAEATRGKQVSEVSKVPKVKKEKKINKAIKVTKKKGK
ncbi:MAG: 30S ribosomal protein S6 [bacterium]|nr:30S ribosomal protein S6 [bacterium]